jgi:predicted nuclease of restriction endonuclease-like (RecB) superfamily
LAKKKTQPSKTSKSPKKSAPTKSASKRVISKKAVGKSSGELSRQRRDNSDSLLADIRDLVVEARQQTAQVVNAALTLTYWQVGTRIRTDVLQKERAEYGEEILPTLSAKLVPEFGRGFSEKNLRRMAQFAEIYPKQQIVVSLIRQLSWTHFIALLPLKDPLQRDFYAEMCRLERWSVRTLRAKIGGMLFERTAISKKPDKLVAQELAELRESDLLTPDLVFRDPYFLDFLGLKDTYSESDLEAAILRELESFILELGVGFSFVDRLGKSGIRVAEYLTDLPPREVLQQKLHDAVRSARARLSALASAPLEDQ